MTLSVAKAIIETIKLSQLPLGGYETDHQFHSLLREKTVYTMQKIGRKYPNCGFGGLFYQWVFSDNPKPYHSFGNGAAMRVSPAGFAARTESEAESIVEAVTDVTHNHREGIKGAKAVAVAIWLARNGATKTEILDRITRQYYPLDFKIDDIRQSFQFNETCQETVSQRSNAFWSQHHLRMRFVST